MSVTAIFGKVAGREPHIDDAIEPRKMIRLVGDELIDEHGLVLAERVFDEENQRVFWRPLCKTNEPTFGDSWLAQEIVFVGQGRLNL